MNLQLITLSLVLFICSAFAENKTNDSFSKAKKILEKQVYYNNRVTLYCAAAFDPKKYITPPNGFKTTKYVQRAKKNAWEHVVPAEILGEHLKNGEVATQLVLIARERFLKEEDAQKK
ncbi:MAG: deoxyribonuclease-1 [Psychromonas sp.]|jgi:deoxyribonuclease-1